MSNIEATRVMGAANPTGAQATMVMPSQSDGYRTQMGGTTTCPVCKSTTPMMEPFCGDCGFLLSSSAAEAIAPIAEDAPAGELVDPQTGRRFRLRTGLNTLGRHDTDILVNEGTVSRNHATITLENGAATIEDLASSNGTKVGDLRLSAGQPVRAVSGTPLRFGNWKVVLEIGGIGASAAGAGATIAMPSAASEDDKTLVSSAFSSEDTFTAATLIVPNPTPATQESVEPVSGGAMVGALRKIEGAGDDIAVTEGVITIGRRPENIVVLTDDAYISGRHAEIVTDSTGTYITDVGSTNGTVVNGTKLTANERLLLSEGDELHIGQRKFRFELLGSDTLPNAPAADEGESAKDNEAEGA